MNEDPPWIDPPDPVTEHGEGPRRLRWLLAALAAVPWIVVVAVLAAPSLRAPTPAGTTGTDGPVASVPGGAPTSQPGHHGRSQQPDQPSAPGLTPATPGTDTTPGTDAAASRAAHGHEHGPRADEGPVTDRALEALATVVARSWLTGIGPAIGEVPVTAPDPDRYAEHLVVERIEADGDLALAIVLAVVLDAGDERAPPQLTRVAVPIHRDADRVRLAGTPYDLPVDQVATSALVSHPIADASVLEEVTEALEGAGFGAAELVGVERTASWPVLAHLRLDDQPVTVWLRSDGAAGFRLAGASGTTDHREPTSDQPEDGP
ncbi:MAG: hypothetical protein JJT89_15010 [Nitriliruptoraceae bacterium]|nr:hypothetical protein [Nitriliruptoraceae bacterium]